MAPENGCQVQATDFLKCQLTDFLVLRVAYTCMSVCICINVERNIGYMHNFLFAIIIILYSHA